MELQKPIDTTVKLWEYYFKVRVPYFQTRSIADIRQYGTNLSGIAAIDNDINNQLMTTMMTIAQMAEHFSEGVVIRIVHQPDIKTIYEYISEHIHAWKSKLERGINIGNAPIDDLILLDKFANVIYEHAKYQFTADIANSIMAQHMMNIQRINATNFFTGPAITRTNVDIGNDGVTRVNSESDLPERDSLADFFKNSLINIRRY